MCMHVDGVVQGYRVVPVGQPPSGGGVGEGFSPAAVSECAAPLRAVTCCRRYILPFTTVALAATPIVTFTVTLDGAPTVAPAMTPTYL